MLDQMVVHVVVFNSDRSLKKLWFKFFLSTNDEQGRERVGVWGYLAGRWRSHVHRLMKSGKLSTAGADGLEPSSHTHGAAYRERSVR